MCYILSDFAFCDQKLSGLNHIIIIIPPTMNKNIAGLLLLIISLTGIYFNSHQNTKVQTQFQKWKNQFSITFNTKLEQVYRERVFLETKRKIQQHNANPQRTYDMGLNQFSSLTKEQFIQRYLLVRPQAQVHEEIQVSPVNVDIDWVTQGAVTPPKNQGQCGAVWAFACVGGLQGLSKIAYGTLKHFSEQQLIDCSNPYGNMGCNGGLPVNCYKFVKDRGICEQQDYPYKGTVQTCKNCTNPFKISGYSQANGCNELIDAITHQPVSVTVDASNWAMYKSGVFSNCSNRLNHAGLLVGLLNGVWKIKNSWGASWGEGGYIRLAPGNTCGICSSAATYPNK